MPGKNPMLESERPTPLIEVLSVPQSEEILARNRVGRLAFSFRGRVNVVPVHFVYEKGWVYGRTAPGGKLLQILRNRRVAFEVDEHAALFDWRSVVVHGGVQLLNPADGPEGKARWEHAVQAFRQIVPAAFGPGDPTPHRDVMLRVHISHIEGRTATAIED